MEPETQPQQFITRFVDEIPRNQRAFSVWVITANPSDYPGKHVVREQVVRGCELWIVRQPLAIADTLEEARKSLPFGLFRFAREATDDPVIVETWI